MAVISFLNVARSTIFVNLPMKTAMAVNPLDSSKSAMRSSVTCAHFLEGIPSGYNNPAFTLLSDFIILRIGQVSS